MEETLRDMKLAGRRREDENRRLAEDVKGLQGVVERSIKRVEEGREAGLKELSGELKSLKTLVVNRLGSGGAGGASNGMTGVSTSSAEKGAVNGANMFGVDGTVGVGSAMDGLKNGGADGAANSTAPAADDTVKTGTVSRSEVGSASTGSRSGAASPYSYGQYGAKGGIPAWQLAAAKKSEVQPKVESVTDQSEQASGSKTM